MLYSPEQDRYYFQCHCYLNWESLISDKNEIGLFTEPRKHSTVVEFFWVACVRIPARTGEEDSASCRQLGGIRTFSLGV